MRSIVLVLIYVCLYFVSATCAQRVIEGESDLAVVGTDAVVRLVIEGDAAASIRSARLDLIDASDSIRSSVTRSDIPVTAGKLAVEFRLPLGNMLKDENEYLGWFRLRYSIGNEKGTIALSHLMKDLFELRVIASNHLAAGTTYRARIRAVNPFNGLPVSGVMIESALKLELKEDTAEPVERRVSAETDTEGFAVVDFEIPPEYELDEGSIEIVGKKGGLVRVASDEPSMLIGDIEFVSMMDKPIYQPGQTINVRGIVLKGRDGKTVLPGAELEFRVQDEDDTLLFRETVRSSEYGIASMSWKIPANVRLGNYQITVLTTDDRDIARLNAKVSRYDLPNFIVNAKASKPYYLPPDKQAEVEVRADYLFGRPVAKGKVRVVQEKERTWNWKQQKYDISEGAVREGETDAEGKFVAKFDLKETHEDLEEEEQYKDLSFAAYFTDPTTNKTEQRRFDIRVSREPIHVYLIQGKGFRDPRLPLMGFVSTFYADGTPAECDVEIKASEEDEGRFKTYAKLKTNSYGVGRIEMPKPNIGGPDDDLDLRIVAKDKNGRKGVIDENIYFADWEEQIRVDTDRSIYKPGDTVTVKIRSTVSSGTIYVDVLSGWSVVDSRFAVLKNGKAELQIPYKEAFKGELSVAAYIEDPDDNDTLVSGGRGIIFPSKQGIRVDAEFDKAVYKPNEEATLRFSTLDIAGRAVESALGVVVFDKAVEERARTDSEIGGVFRGLYGLLGYGGGYGSFNIKDINELDVSKPISEEMQQVAAVMLHNADYHPGVFRSRRYYSDIASAYGPSVAAQMRGVAASLHDTFTKRNGLHPVNDAGLRSILEGSGIDFDSFRDPWGMPFRAEFSVERDRDIVTVKTAGPDKIFDTADDFVAHSSGFEYFTQIGKAIDAAAANYNARTGDFIRDAATLAAEMGTGQLTDRWGRPYRIRTDGRSRNIELKVVSAGPDGRHENREGPGDDFVVWTASLDLFASLEGKIAQVQRALKRPPLTVAEFNQTLKNKGINLDQFRDGHGNPVHISVERSSRYWNRVTVETVQPYGDLRPADRQVVTPVTQEIVRFTIASAGADGKIGNYDDVTLTQFVHVLSERSKDDPAPVQTSLPAANSKDAGSIAGTVTDANGAVVPAAVITVANSANSLSRLTSTDDNGRFVITGLPAGNYSVTAESPGFQRTVAVNVPVTLGSATAVEITLQAGGISNTVEITAGAEVLNTTSSAMSTTVNAVEILALPRGAVFSHLHPGIMVVTRSGTKGSGSATSEPTSTPRLREYFPETLLWQPQVITDADGKAELKFRMADNITTWKMYTIASTRNGKVGFAEKEVAAFQAFFVDLDPPKFLTTGDEIFLPTQVRNYTETKQRVNVTMANAEWFTFVGCGDTNGNTSCDTAGMRRSAVVDSGGSENTIFGFRAAAPVVDAKQRVTAVAETDSDAIERPVTVRPDGREVVHTESRYFVGEASLSFDLPADALDGASTAELKIYPNLMAHVAESVEGLLRRPYGCGEQTISSTYPNLMILKFASGRDGKPRRISESVERRARKFLQDGYERLLNYQVAEGGFSYWGGKDTPDFALTAYALQFLSDASAFVSVDADVVKKAEDWLARQQSTDGSWRRSHNSGTIDDEGRVRSATTFVARTLAKLAAARRGSSEPADPQVSMDPVLARALTYLKQRNAEIDDPYSLSLFGLAAMDSGDETLAREVGGRIATLAKDESGAVYWNLESNTAFNGWGSAGRIETTALAAQLLIRLKMEPEIARKAILFLIRNKDRYGVWYSTQTTVNVLDALVASLAADDTAGNVGVSVLLNGQLVRTIEIGPDSLEQIAVDLSGKLAPGTNTVQLRSRERMPLMAQVVSAHYIDWRNADASGRKVTSSAAVRLEYKCDRTEAAIMQEIGCSVEAERIGYRGYGMLLAEIGTPPGADVSRESLQAAVEADGSISRYEILPDRIVLYMWARPGGTKLNFKFRPRYGINAQTPASVLYDYYNPEAQATAAPLRFRVN